jgi:hypothetical protein
LAMREGDDGPDRTLPVEGYYSIFKRGMKVYHFHQGCLAGLV